jgi:phosphoenolpyruvate---glycerone phosphotransferase subunit DhaL
VKAHAPAHTTELALDATFARRWVAEFITSFTAHAQMLADLDRQVGDGDFGTNLKSALGRAEAFIDRDQPQTFADVFFAVSKGFLNTGGTSGPLFGMWFRDIAKATSAEPANAQALASGVATGLATIQRLAGAVVGDSTMVDAIAPAAAALTTAATDGATVREALTAAADAAAAGAQSTRDLIANRGRASYVGDVARGVLDPGAVAVALLFAAAVTTHSGTTSDTSWLVTR